MSEEKTIILKFRNIMAGLAVLLFLLSIFSYSSMDLAVLDGGVSEPLNNWVGPLGAHVSKICFYLFGIAVYPLILLFSLCVIRSFMPYPTNRKGYWLFLVCIVFGTSLLFALSPEKFVTMTDQLGIGHIGEPDLALSGGTFGALFAAPPAAHFPAGLIRRCIGPIGTAVCATVFLLTGLVFLFLADWKVFFANPQRISGRKKTVPREEPEEAVPEEEAPQEEVRPRKWQLAVPFRKKEKTAEPAPAASVPEEIPSPDPRPVQTQAVVSETLSPAPEEKVVSPVETSSVPPAASSNGNVHDPYAADQVSTVTVSRRTAVIPNSNLVYELPQFSLLDKPKEIMNEESGHLDLAMATLQETLNSFEISGHVERSVVGPRITRFEIALQPGVKVERVTQIQNNIAKDMRAESIRIQAPIPGSDMVGIELPNKVSNMVYLRELLESEAWRNSKASIPIILGKDVAGKVMITDLAKAPHLLIAGSTGSGKSVCMNTLLISMLYKFSPFDLKLILVDPKYVELAIYRPIPHLITPVVNDPTKVPYALRWGVNEMEHRYQMMARVKAKNLEAFNGRPPDPEPVYDEKDEVIPAKLPLLVIIIDELADIMMTEAKKDVETSICRIAQKGRAAGIHLVIATQTPRKDIITGTIKANLPTKIAFKVSTRMDSQVILDTPGAEKLLGKGDMLFKGPAGETERIQGSMVSDPEIQKIADCVSNQVEQHFDTTVVLSPEEVAEEEADDGQNSFPEETFDDGDDYIRSTVSKYLHPGDDENLKKALEIILRENQASISYLQRRMGIGYNKAAELIDSLEKKGIVSKPLPGGQKRKILIFDELNRPED